MSDNVEYEIVGELPIIVNDDNSVSEHYISQLKDSISWLTYAKSVETDPVKVSKLERELNEAQASLSRINNLNG